MKEYFAAWEIYSKEWALIEKGYQFFIIESDGHLRVSMANFCERKAIEKNIGVGQITFTSVQQI